MFPICTRLLREMERKEKKQSYLRVCVAPLSSLAACVPRTDLWIRTGNNGWNLEKACQLIDRIDSPPVAPHLSEIQTARVIHAISHPPPSHCDVRGQAWSEDFHRPVDWLANFSWSLDSKRSKSRLCISSRIRQPSPIAPTQSIFLAKKDASRLEK